jgi:hypothetical protein
MEDAGDEMVQHETKTPDRLAAFRCDHWHVYRDGVPFVATDDEIWAWGTRGIDPPCTHGICPRWRR